ncbi:hypothetical protein [Acidovorax sp.]|uniref:hypothetical protein n=1 Tax=Acidovorax sp. TaxID=1872122 RepID=UPI0025BB0FF4|nr:hypothetical protein [Acidovorax sp.]MBW8462712.1 hypothetical protein [Acidovorax sp.]
MLHREHRQAAVATRCRRTWLQAISSWTIKENLFLHAAFPVEVNATNLSWTFVTLQASRIRIEIGEISTLKAQKFSDVKHASIASCGKPLSH